MPKLRTTKEHIKKSKENTLFSFSSIHHHHFDVVVVVVIEVKSVWYAAYVI
jgi:hypothetical protein